MKIKGKCNYCGKEGEFDLNNFLPNENIYCSYLCFRKGEG